MFTPRMFAMLTGLDEKTSSVYLARWSGAGLIESAGDKTGVYFNRLKGRYDPGKAILLLYPEAVLSGASVLNAAGLTTQSPYQLDANILNLRHKRQFKDAMVHLRPQAWFRAVHDNGGLMLQSEAGFSLYGLGKTLTPEFALADCFLDEDHWHPDPDDIDLDGFEWDEVEKAWSCMSNKPIPDGLDRISEYKKRGYRYGQR